MNGKSRFVWHDLNTNDSEAAKRFYGELFNWHFDPGIEERQQRLPPHQGR